ncbi:MAG: glycosyltransferase family 4 protein [Myxococcota bacterium]
MGPELLYVLTSPGIPVGGNSGASHHVTALVNAFAAEGQAVTLLAARQVEGPDPLPLARLVELPTQKPPWWRRSRSQRERWQAQRFAQRALEVVQGMKPRFIYERYALFSDVGHRLRPRLGCPWVLEVNAPLRLERSRYEGLRISRAVLRAEGEILRQADKVLAVSTPLADWLTQEVGVPSSRVEVMWNGVDNTRFAPQTPDETLRLRLGLGDGPVVGFVGSLKPWHGLQNWVEVLARLAERMPSVQGLVVGEGPERALMEEVVTRQGLQHRVHFTGRRPGAEVPALLALMDVLLAPFPHQELFYFCPLKVLEAQAMGIPVVTTAQGDLPTLVGQGGAVVPPGDELALVEALVAVLMDARVRARWREAGLMQSQGRDWRAVAQRILAKMA